MKRKNKEILSSILIDLEKIKEIEKIIYGLSFYKLNDNYSIFSLCSSKNSKNHKYIQGFFNEIKENPYNFCYPNEIGLKIQNILNIPLAMIRSKIAKISNKTPYDWGWHKDEKVFDVLRLNIPILTSKNFYFQIDNYEAVNLEVGKGYYWDTNKIHRAYSNSEGEERIHLILGFSPWKDFKNDVWTENTFHNRIHPLDIFNEIFKEKKI